MSPKKNLSRGPEEGDLTKIILAIIGLISTVGVAYFGYRQATDPLRISTSATQTAVSLVAMATIAPSVTAVPSLEPTGSPTTTFTAISPSPTSPPSDTSGYHIILASCDCKEVTYSDEALLLRLRWGAKTRELAENGADFVNYSVRINGEQIPEIEKYRKPATHVESPYRAGDLPNAWWVYWDIPLQNEFELHFSEENNIETTITTSVAIDTGWGIIPAGTTRSFTTVTVYIPLR